MPTLRPIFSARTANILRGFGPAMARPRLMEAMRAGAGAGLALGVCGLVLAALGGFGNGAGFILIAPLGATAFLVFAVPNSPLAQPWSALVGNGVSALIAVTVLQLELPLPYGAGLAVCLSILAMALLRAMHPPGGAVALSTMLSAQLAGSLGYGYVLAPVLLDTAILVLAATAYNRLTGRKYPFRQPQETKSASPSPDRRLGLGPEELGELLRRFRLSANIGAEDFGRVLAAAEEEAAKRHLSGLTCAHVMSRHIVSVPPTARLRDVADIFIAHRFKSLPVLDAEGRILGILTQTSLIEAARALTLPAHKRLLKAMAALLNGEAAAPLAQDVMTKPDRRLAPHEKLGAALDALSEHHVQTLPVVEGEKLVGLISRSDLLAALSRLTIMPDLKPATENAGAETAKAF